MFLVIECKILHALASILHYCLSLKEMVWKHTTYINNSDLGHTRLKQQLEKNLKITLIGEKFENNFSQSVQKTGWEGKKRIRITRGAPSAQQGNSDLINKIESSDLILVLHSVTLERKVIATEYYFERRTSFDETLGTS